MFENRHSHSSFAPPVAGPQSGIQSFTAFFKHGEDQIRQGLSSVVQWPSFLSGSSSRPGDGGSMQHQLRAQQLRSLRQLVPNIGQITHDESQWSLKLVDAQHQLLTQIFVTLPLQFPSAAPDIRVSPLVDHPWVDRDGAIVGHPSVGRNWHPGRDLGIVMAEVLNEFTQRAPRSVGTNSIPSAGGVTPQQPQMVSPPAGLNPGHSYQFQATARTPPSTSPHHHGQEGASSGGPSGGPTGATGASTETANQNNELIIPERFPEIDGLAEEHLEYLKGAEREAFQEFLQETADFQEMKSKLITVMEANMLLTKQTLQKEPNLVQLEKEVAEGASKVVGERALVLALEERRDELRKMFSRKQQAQRLHLAHLSAHEEAEALHRLDGKGAGETRKNYFEARKREHRLAAQKDRMRELLEEYG